MVYTSEQCEYAGFRRKQRHAVVRDMVPPPHGSDSEQEQGEPYGTMRARRYPFDMPKRRFYSFNPKVCHTFSYLAHVGIFHNIPWMEGEAPICAKLTRGCGIWSRKAALGWSDCLTDYGEDERCGRCQRTAQEGSRDEMASQGCYRLI